MSNWSRSKPIELFTLKKAIETKQKFRSQIFKFQFQSFVSVVKKRTGLFFKVLENFVFWWNALYICPNLLKNFWVPMSDILYYWNAPSPVHFALKTQALLRYKCFDFCGCYLEYTASSHIHLLRENTHRYIKSWLVYRIHKYPRHPCIRINFFFGWI